MISGRVAKISDTPYIVYTLPLETNGYPLQGRPICSFRTRPVIRMRHEERINAFPTKDQLHARRERIYPFLSDPPRHQGAA